MLDTCVAARVASVDLALLPRERKDAALECIADAIERRRDEIITENAEDVALARRARLSGDLIDRLLLDEGRLAEAAERVRAVKRVADPVGQVSRGWRLPNGLEVREERVPFGVVAVIYEARPLVTVDAAAVCLKAGNATVLRGGAAAKHSNRMLAEVVEGAIIEAGLPDRAVSHLSTDTDDLLELLTAKDGVDLVVPRGGQELQEYVRAHSVAPALYATGGNCHVYVDAAADLDKARRIVVNAKCQRPAECSSIETLLVHGSVARPFLPGVLGDLVRRGVEVVGDRSTVELAPDVPVKRANRAHFATEFEGPKIAVKVVATLSEAVAHINEFGSGHSEAIVTEDMGAARSFTARVDAACVYVNASTRFTGGEQFGSATDLGVSTQKLHARGPLGPRELTCCKFVIWGDGQILG